MNDSQALPNPSKPVNPIKRLLKYGRRYRLKAWLASICSLLNKFFDLAPPALIGIAVDVVVKQQDSLLAQWGIKDVFWQLAIITILSAIVWALESIFEYAYDYLDEKSLSFSEGIKQKELPGVKMRVKSWLKNFKQQICPVKHLLGLESINVEIF